MKEYKTNCVEYHLVKEQKDFKRVKINSSTDAADYMRNFYSNDIGIIESFFMMTLNNANNVTGYVKISQGGMTGTVVDVRIVAKYAVESLCTSVILGHNHPSGNLNPSGADKHITSKVKSGLELLDIKVLDHIILTEESFFSFADEGLI